MPAIPSFRFITLLTSCLFLLVTTPAAEQTTAAWLDRVNFYRATASLPPVVEEPALSMPVSQHARYMVENNVIQHRQNRRHSWSTADGAAAAAASNLAGSLSSNEPDWWAVDVWMQAPFHALGILDPALNRVGFGIYRERNRGGIQTAAGLDVIRGRSHSPAAVTYPIVWPAHDMSVPIGTHLSESPSPLASCPGYRAPAGLPVIVQIGSGAETPRVTRSWISDGPTLLDHCVFDENTYRNRSRVEQELARSILAARDAIILIPREPLRAGSSYQVHIETGGRSIDWTFRVSAPGN